MQKILPRTGLIIIIALPSLCLSILSVFLVPHLRWQGFIDIVQDAYIQKIILFTLFQASLSAILSIFFAIFIARMIWRQFYHWRYYFQYFCLFITILPPIMVVFALVNLYGASGIISQILQFLNLTDTRLYYLYGLNGILLGHIFLNLPLALFIILHQLDEIPKENWQQALLLNFSSKSYRRQIEYPILRQIFPPLFGIIFTFCALSFTIILSLGGKPNYNTLEVAIYQAIKYDFDLTLAAGLGMIQMLCCIIVLSWVFVRKTPASFFRITEKKLLHVVKHHPWQKKMRNDAELLTVKLIDYGWLLLFFATIILPLLSLFSPRKIDLPANILTALSNSLIISFASCLLALILCFIIILSAQYYRKQAELLLFAGYTVFIIPPILLSGAVFILFHSVSSLLIVIIINALMVLPIMLKIIAPPALQIYDNQHYLSKILPINRWQYLWQILLPQLKIPILLASNFAICMSFGDLNVIALFGNENFITLPFLIFNLLSTYRIDQAFVLFNFMLVIYLIIFRILYHYAKN